MHCLSRLICIALLALWTAHAAHAGDPAFPAHPADTTNPTHIADVDIDDVPVGRALRLLAEIYDVSIVTGQLPETRVTVRLRGVSAREAFESLAVAAELTVVVEGTIVRVAPKSGEPTVRQIVPGPFPEGAEAGLAELRGAGVEVRRMGDGSFLVEGAKNAVEAAAAALGSARQHLLVERVFHLGVASGEETLKAVVPLLEPHLEVASYDANGHLLTVSALPATIARIESLLAELTRPPAQFEIEVRVVEVSRTALEQLGAQGSFGLDVSGGVLATTFPLSGLSGARRYLPSASDLATLRNLGGAGGGSTSGTGTFSDSGFRFGRIDGTGIRLLIQALEQSGEARVVATPKVTALDNHRAKISMVTTLRIPTFTQNQAFATTTVSGIEQIDVGTTLEVLPRKGEGRQILLKVIPEVSELSPQVETFTQSGLTQGLPIITRRRTDTEVILGGGETLVIGGLVTERESKTKGKTPGLADIPLLGRAFRLEGKNTDNSELLVFVTPRELPSPEERRTRARVDDSWIPNGLAAQVDAARAQIHAQQPADRLAGISTLEQIDRDLLAAGVDVGRDVAGLGADASLEVRVAAALFLLHERPANALGELVRFADSRAVALSALAAPMAPHLRAALAELLGQSAGGAEALAHQLDLALDVSRQGDSAAAFHLGEALCVASPALAAERAARIGGLARQAGDGLGAETLRLDALSGAPGSAAELAARAVDAPSPEARSFALAGLVRSLGSRGTAELLAGRSAVALPASLVARVRTLASPAPLATAGPATPTPPATRETEPALGWSGAPAEIVIRGDVAGSALVREALDLLARRAPDLRHLVGFGLATIEAGAPSPGVDPAVRSARVTAGGDRDLTPERLALQLVRLATLVFESRVRGFPAASGRNLARAVREEIHALERLTGAPCSPQRAAATVGQVLAAARSGEGPAHESAGAVGGGR